MIPSHNVVPAPRSFGNGQQMRIYTDGLDRGAPALPISLDALRERARAALSPEAFAYIGGAGEERTMHANRADFERWRIVPRMLTDISSRSLESTIHGCAAAAPLIVAPIGLHELYSADGEFPAARAAAARRIPFTLSCQSSRTIEDVAHVMGDAVRFFQLYWSRDRELTRSFIRRAEAAGYSALVVTLDTRLLGWRPRDLDLGHNPFLHGKGLANYLSDPVFLAALPQTPAVDRRGAVQHFLSVFNDLSLTWSDLAWLRENTRLPITLKGILHPDDARRALDGGVEGVIVSNHGGRQLDGSISAIGALPAVADAVGGRMEIGLDSGVHSGADAVKALALGADYVGLGRPLVYGLAAGGEAGVGWVLDNFLAELDLTLALAGCTSPAAAGPGVAPRAESGRMNVSDANLLSIRRARVPVALLPVEFADAGCDPLDPAVLCDLTLRGSTIVAVENASREAKDGAREFDAGGRLVFPAFVEAHTHLDRAHTWSRSPNRSHTFRDALATLARDEVQQTPADLRLRAGFALRCAWAHGTRLVRTHVACDLAGADRRHALMAELRNEWSDRIALQTVALCSGADYAKADGEKLSDIAVRHGVTALGGFFVMSADLPLQIGRLLTLARERGLGIDLHVDETGDPASECLRVVAEEVIRQQFDLPVVCGHCCSLAMQPAPRQRETIARVKAARIGVIALPLCNLHLQDRRPPGASLSPHWRGLAPVLDLLEAGVPVACASDNVRDGFYPYGDLDAVEVYVQSLRLAHLDRDLARSVQVVTSTAADLVGCPDRGRICPGARANLVVFEAQSFSELLSRPSAPRRCIDDGQVRALPLPDFEELRAAGLMTISP